MAEQEQTAQEQILAGILRRLDDLSNRWQRTEQAILGDPAVGHVGIVVRMAAVEADRAGAEERRREGDARAHERIDLFEEKLDAELERLRGELRQHGERLNRLVWTAAGIAAGITGGSLGILQAVLSN